jgi:glycosyltransferase involved in cell wall biosynthesis
LVLRWLRKISPKSGDGPLRASFQKRYPEVLFTGYLFGDKLAKAYSEADVFVFPSKTDTFGQVILEAMACGVPIAAYPVQGPIDLVIDPRLGCLSHDIEHAIETALKRGDRKFCTEYARRFSWEKVAQHYLDNVSCGNKKA